MPSLHPSDHKKLESFHPHREALLRFFYPEACGVCHKFLDLEESILCGPCLAQLEALKRSPLDTLEDDRFEWLDDAWALFAYRSPLKEILAGIKFGGKRRWLEVFDPALGLFTTMTLFPQPYDGLIPIPLDWQRRLEREFNQARVIAEMISKWTGAPILGNMVHKKHSTARQSELNRSERLVNLWGTFKVSSKTPILNKSFLVVDDIITTGATGEEVARVLKKRGAKRVDLLALARTELEPK